MQKRLHAVPSLDTWFIHMYNATQYEYKRYGAL